MENLICSFFFITQSQNITSRKWYDIGGKLQQKLKNPNLEFYLYGRFHPWREMTPIELEIFVLSPFKI